MAAATTLVLVTDIIDLIPDPQDPVNSTLIEWVFKILFLDPNGPLEEQGAVSVLNTDSKAQMKSAVNGYMQASVVAKGGTLSASRILTVADIAG